MGMKIFEASGTFDPSRYGLGAGSIVQIICVGGGAGGESAKSEVVAEPDMAVVAVAVGLHPGLVGLAVERARLL